MFTGIIETTGTIESVQRLERSVRLGVRPALHDYSVAVGGSVAIDGSCLTLESASGGVLFFTAVFETLRRTTLAHAKAGMRTNLERALRIGDRLDGHLVLGHVDGIGRIVKDVRIGESLVRTIAVPRALSRFIALKGSITVDGLSLTIAKTAQNEFNVSLIPHTVAITTVFDKKPGDAVNLECDVMARYTARLLGLDNDIRAPEQVEDGAEGRLMSLLEQMYQ